MQGLVQAGVHDLLRQADAVVGDADVKDLALLLRLQHAFVQAAAVAGSGHEGGVVELIDVDVVRAQIPQAGLQVGPECLRLGGPSLGGNVDFVPQVREGCAQLFLTVGVAAGGIEVGDASLQGPAQQRHRFLLGDALDRQCAEGHLIHGDPGFSQSVQHRILLL